MYYFKKYIASILNTPLNYVPCVQFYTIPRRIITTCFIGLVLLIITIILFSSISELNRCNLDVTNTKTVILLTESAMATTIVTAYFPLAKSKHSTKEYLSWLENLLSFCETPMVIFTSHHYQSTLLELRHRRNPLPTHFVVDYESPLEMPPIKKHRSALDEQLSMDPERRYHTVELYAIWCAKSFMLNYSAHINHFHSDFFLYIDAGSFRSQNYRFRKWPRRLPTKLITENRLLLAMIAPLPHSLCPLNHSFGDNYSPITHNLVEGGLIGGSSSVIHWWTAIFYDTVDWYRSRKLFFGKDQYVLNAVALAHANRVMILLSFHASSWCGNVWFVYGPLLADGLLESSSFVRRCQRRQSLAKITIPLDRICSNSYNVN